MENFLKYLCFICLSILIIGCDKSDELPNSQDDVVEESPLYLNGVSTSPDCSLLVFESYSAFLNIYEQIASSIEDSEQSFLNQYPCHKSSVEVIEDIENLIELESTTENQVLSEIENNSRAIYEEIDSTISPVIEDPILSLFINNNGVFQIGDSIYYFTPEYMRSFVLDPVITLDENLKNVNRIEETTSEVTVYEILRDYSRAEKKCYIYSGSKLRMKGGLWKVNLHVIRGAGASTKSQKKKWRWWFGKKADKLSLSVTPLGSNTITKTKRNKKRVRIITSFAAWLFTNADTVTELEQVPDNSTPLQGYHCKNDNCCSTERD